MFAAQFLPHLADGFDKRQRLDVTDGAPDLHQANVHILRDLLHRGLDFIGDVGNDLHGLAQVVAAALLGDDLLVEAAGGPVVVARKFGVGEALVVAKIEIGFGAVVSDEDLAVLKWRHRSGIHVQVGVELHQVDLEAPAFEQASHGGRRQSLAQ